MSEVLKDQAGTGWEVDVHSHAQDIHESIRKAMEEAAKEHRPCTKRKSYLSDELWRLIMAKKDIRKELYSWKAWEKRNALGMCFAILKGEFQEAADLRDQYTEARIGACSAFCQFQTVGKEVTRQIRQADEAFFQKFADDLTRFDSPTTQKALWSEIGRYLPKNKARKRSTRTDTLDDTSLGWTGYLCQLEAGEVKDFGKIYEQNIRHHNVKNQTVLKLSEIPTLLQVESVLRTSKQGKAPGVDKIPGDVLHYMPQTHAKLIWPLIAKMVLWAAEPIQFKGGEIRWLHKKGPWDQVQNYRGILLGSSIGKRAHALIRSPLMLHLDTARDRGQIGGVRHQETLYGNQFMRSFVRAIDAAGYVSAVMFVDLSTAFHSMIRELLTGIGDLESLDPERDHITRTIMDNIRRIGGETDALEEMLKEQGYMEEIQTPKFLRNLVAEIGEYNWAKVGNTFVQTHKGTRPGSPIADSLFHFLMSKINNIICQELDQEIETKQLCSDLQFESRPILWADDLAVGVAARENSAILPAVERLASRIEKAFTKHGLKVNYGRQKTEVMVTFKGKGASKCRTRWLAGDSDTCKVRDPKKDGEMVHEMHMTASYKHLGILHAGAGKLEIEVNYRIAQTWAAWRVVQKPLFTSRCLSRTTKVKLAYSLLMTKLLHGTDTWPVMPKRLIRRVGACYVHILRAATGELFRKDKADEFKSEEAFLCAHGLPSIEICIAQKRLCYAARLQNHGINLLYEVLHAEDRLRDDSWMAALRGDVRWLIAVAGNSWGCSLEQMQTNWVERKGWKQFVKRATKKHVMQEQIAHRVAKEAGSPGKVIIDLTGEHRMSLWSLLSKSHCTGGPSDTGAPTTSSRILGGTFHCLQYLSQAVLEKIAVATALELRTTVRKSQRVLHLPNTAL